MTSYDLDKGRFIKVIHIAGGYYDPSSTDKTWRSWACEHAMNEVIKKTFTNTHAYIQSQTYIP